MKFLKVIFSGLLVSTTHFVQANDIPDLQVSISNLTGSELSAFESQVGETSITENIEVAVEAAIEAGGADMPAALVPELSSSVVNSALAEGFITEAEAADLNSALDLYQANEQYFDFNFAETIAQAIAAEAANPGTGITPEQAATMMSAFNQLSEAGKTAVGSESFDFSLGADGSNSQGLSRADWTIICSIDCGTTLDTNSDGTVSSAEIAAAGSNPLSDASVAILRCTVETCNL